MSPQLQIESVADAKRQWMIFVSESNLSTKTDLKNGGFCSCEQFAEPLLEGSSLSTARSWNITGHASSWDKNEVS